MTKIKCKKKWIYIDADPLLFECTEGTFTKMSMFSAENGDIETNYKEPLKQYKEKFKQLVQNIEDEIAVELIGQIKGTKVILSDPNKCFRYDIYPEYKGARSESQRGPLFYRLRKWALKKYGYVKKVEADDVVSHYVRKGHVGATMDKDMLRGVGGIWFDTYHTRREIKNISDEDALKFNFIQTLMGDTTDNIPALPKNFGDSMINGISNSDGTRKPYKVTEKIAVELLDKHGWSWAGVLAAYQEKGFGEKEFLLNARLILLTQWHPKKGITLFKPSLI